MRSPFLLLVLLAVAAAPADGRSMVFGSESDPELADANNDVTYDSLYPGGRGHQYLDLVAAWYDYNQTRDEVSLTLKMADTSGLMAAPSDLQVSCVLTARFAVDGSTTSYVQFTWDKMPNNQTLASHVNWRKGDPQHEGPLGAIPHKFEHTAGSPGYFIWAVPRVELQPRGDELVESAARCVEIYRPAQVARVAENYDEGVGRRVFTVKSLRPVSMDGTADDWGTPTSADQPTETSASDSPAATIVLVLMTLAAAAVGFGRRRAE